MGTRRDDLELLGVPGQLLGLDQAAKQLGICVKSARQLVADDSLPAIRLADRWYVHADDVTEFARTWEPPRRARPAPRPRPENPNRIAIVLALADWERATAEELAIAVQIHAGNVRKNLALLEAAGLAERGGDGQWSLTPDGYRHAQEVGGLASQAS